jgi:hypothetical protein
MIPSASYRFDHHRDLSRLHSIRSHGREGLGDGIAASTGNLLD